MSTAYIVDPAAPFPITGSTVISAQSAGISITGSTPVTATAAPQSILGSTVITAVAAPIGDTLPDSVLPGGSLVDEGPSLLVDEDGKILT